MNSILTPDQSLVGQSRTGRVIVFDRQQTIIDDLDVSDGELNGSEVWLDFANVEIVNSADLSALIRFSLRMRRQEKTVYALNVGQAVEEIFSITRFPVLRTA